MIEYLVPARQAIVTHRVGEQHIGEVCAWLEAERSLDDYVQRGVRYALIGIPEDIGPRANQGRGGAHGAWTSVLTHCLNAQANRFFPAEQLLIAGHIDVEDLQQQSKQADLEQLRQLCECLDQRVQHVIAHFFKAGIVPIIIGGGHNNAYPILAAYHDVNQQALPVMNCDPHADCRQREGRHSGNPFSYAKAAQCLGHYAVLGLQESANNHASLDWLTEHNAKFVSFEDIAVRQQITFAEAYRSLLVDFDLNAPLGLEIDLDSIAGMPVSAASPYGFSIEQVAEFIYFTANQFKPAYVHLAEGAPATHADGERIVGRGLSLLIQAFIKA